jgi:hypothetical protein
VDLKVAAIRVEKLCSDSASLLGSAPLALCQAAMAVRMAARRESGEPDLVDIPARQYPMHAWYAAMAATCACTDLSGLADAAVRQECGLMLPTNLFLNASAVQTACR